MATKKEQKVIDGKYASYTDDKVLYDQPFDLDRWLSKEHWTNKPIHDNSDRELVDGAFDEDGNRKVGNYVKNIPEDPVDENRNLRTGKFVAGNAGGGRPKGSRNKLTQRFLDRVAERTEVGLSAEEILIDMYQDPEMNPDLRFKAAKTILELTLPKTASVELVDDTNKMSKEQIDNRLKELLAAGLGLSMVSESEDE